MVYPSATPDLLVEFLLTKISKSAERRVEPPEPQPPVVQEASGDTDLALN